MIVTVIIDRTICRVHIQWCADILYLSCYLGYE
uniref:Uncharacterized protein n=1 Tax=Anguilla anguilla TaxID=7936 RepID=A0A0E9QPM4_ANGAN